MLKGYLGQTLDGRFLLTEEIGRGGMSTIFKAQDLHDDHRVVVVKVPLPIFSSGVGAWSIFQREEEIGRQLDHPFILKFLPLLPDRRRAYVVTEYVPGRTLADHLRDRRRLPQSQSLTVASQLCEALQHVHETGFVHYDIKPTNVLLCPDGGIRLIDFGLAHAAVTNRFSWFGPAPGIASSDYVAPEQIKRRRGRKSVDIYGVGVVLYEMLTGQPPFPGDDPFVVASVRTIADPTAPRRVNPDISRQVEEIVLRALRRDPAERYPSPAAMKVDLDHPDLVAVSGFCDRLRPVTRWRRTIHIARRVALLGVLPVVTQVVLFLLLWRHYASKG